MPLSHCLIILWIMLHAKLYIQPCRRLLISKKWQNRWELCRIPLSGLSPETVTQIFYQKRRSGFVFWKCYPLDVSLMNARKNAFCKKTILDGGLNLLFYLALCRKYGVGYDVYYHKTESYEVWFLVVCHRATQFVELVQVSYDISSEKTLNRETSALVKAGTSLKMWQIDSGDRLW